MDLQTLVLVKWIVIVTLIVVGLGGVRGWYGKGWLNRAILYVYWLLVAAAMWLVILTNTIPR